MQSQIRRAHKQALENARLYNLVAWAHLPKLISCYVLNGIGDFTFVIPNLFRDLTDAKFRHQACKMLKQVQHDRLYLSFFVHSRSYTPKEVSV